MEQSSTELEGRIRAHKLEDGMIMRYSETHLQQNGLNREMVSLQRSESALLGVV